MDKDIEFQGKVIKCKVISPDDLKERSEITDLITNYLKLNWNWEDIIEEWVEIYSSKYNLYFLPYSRYKSTFSTSPSISDYIERVHEEEILFYKILDTVNSNDLSKLMEWSTIGQIITPFMINFYNFEQMVKKVPDNFFHLELNEFLLNSIKPQLVSKPLEAKLTGRAAEIAKRRKLLSKAEKRI
jgi:hypothetical protein